MDLESMFDTAVASKRAEEQNRRNDLVEMDARGRKWIDEMVEKLQFLRERGFIVEPYFGGIIDNWPCNYIKVAPRGGRPSVEIEPRYYGDMSVFNTSSLTRPFQLKGEDTLESFIKKLTAWTR